MGWRFRRGINIGPVRINLGRRGGGSVGWSRSGAGWAVRQWQGLRVSEHSRDGGVLSQGVDRRPGQGNRRLLRAAHAVDRGGGLIRPCNLLHCVRIEAKARRSRPPRIACTCSHPPHSRDGRPLGRRTAGRPAPRIHGHGPQNASRRPRSSPFTMASSLRSATVSASDGPHCARRIPRSAPLTA